MSRVKIIKHTAKEQWTGQLEAVCYMETATQNSMLANTVSKGDLFPMIQQAFPGK